MEKVLNAKSSFRHLFGVLTIAFLFCSFLYILVIPIIYWMAFGEGEASSRIDEMPLNIFIHNWGALIVTLIIFLVPWMYNIKKQGFRSAKSYAIAAVILSIMYLFRISIAGLFVGLF